MGYLSTLRDTRMSGPNEFCSDGGYVCRNFFASLGTWRLQWPERISPSAGPFYTRFARLCGRGLGEAHSKYSVVCDEVPNTRVTEASRNCHCIVHIRPQGLDPAIYSLQSPPTCQEHDDSESPDSGFTWVYHLLIHDVGSCAGRHRTMYS